MSVAALNLVCLRARAKTYIVKQGDTLSTIAQAHYGSPVYGRDGWLRRILKLNPTYSLDKPIYPGQIVILVDAGTDPVAIQSAPRCEDFGEPLIVEKAAIAPPDDVVVTVIPQVLEARRSVAAESAVAPSAAVPVQSKIESSARSTSQSGSEAPPPQPAVSSPAPDFAPAAASASVVSTPRVQAKAAPIAQEAPSQAVAAQPAQPTPVTQPTPTSQAFKQHSALIVEPEAFYMRLDGVDSRTQGTAVILSDLNIGVGAHWQFVWTDFLRSSVGFEVVRVEMQEQDNGKTVEGKSQTFTGFGLNVEGDFFKDLSIGADAWSREEAFFVSSTTTSVRLERVAVPELGAYLKYNLIQPKPLGISLDAGTKVLLPASTSLFQSQTGTGFYGGISFVQKFNSFSVNLGVRFDQSRYSTNIADQNRTDLGLRLSIRTELGQ